MNFKLIDYSTVYYGIITKSILPEKRSGKFVQIRNGNDDMKYFVLSPNDLSKFHANIVERLCSLRNPSISGEYYDKRNSFLIYDEGWIVQGGGRWEVDNCAKTLKLFGFSKAYGSFNSEGLKEKLLNIDNLSGYLIQID